MSGSASAAAPDPKDETEGQGTLAGEPTEPPARPAGAATQRPSADVAGQRAPADTAGQRPAAPIDDPPPVVPQPAAPEHERETRGSAWARDPHADFLITSTDRDAAEARLRQAVADDLLTLDQFGDRMRAVLEARTRGDLQDATAGIPSAAEPRRQTRERGTARPAPRHQQVIAIMSESAVRGRWRPSHDTTAVAVMGNAVVDLQGAEYEGDELKINAVSWMGTVEIIVPEGVEVELSGFAIMGERSIKLDAEVLPDSPLVRVDAYAVMGSVEVRHPKRKERLTDDRGAFADRVPLLHAETHERRIRRAAPVPLLQRLRRGAGGLLAAAALLVPLGWALSSDDVAAAVFGETEHVVSTQALQAGETLTVGTPIAFGSVTIRVPEGVNVERDGVVIFGSADCAACGVEAADAPTVVVRTIGAFGSVEINPVPSAGSG